MLGASALALTAGPASAEYIQTLGLGQKTSSLAGAVTATSDDFDAFYTNPAGAANFTTPVIGLTAKLIDTTNLEVNDGAGGGVKDTWKGEALAIAPALGAYLPVMPGSVVMGLGIGAPFALAADYNDQDFGRTVTNDSASNIELLYIEATPTVAVKVNDRLNFGLGVNVGLAKHLKLTTKFSNLGGLNGALTALMVAPAGNPGVQGTLLVESDNDMPLPVAPWEFSTDPTAVTFTIGMQYKILPNLTFGAVYRGETPNEYEGEVRLFTNLNSFGGPLAGFCTNLGGGTTPASCGTERFRTTIELPRHVQLGLAWQATDNWELTFDVQWTNWSDATGFGTPLNVALTESQNGNNAPFGAGGAGLQGMLCQLVIAVPTACGIDQIHFGYDAQDAMAYRVGSKYDLNQTVSLLMGYAYEEQFMPNRTQDLITPSSDRHLVTGGVELNVPSAMGLWRLNLGGQVIFYEENTVGGSSTAGGLGPTAQVGQIANVGQGPANSVVFGTQTNPYTIDGHLWTVGLGATLFFGATEAPAR